MTNANQTRWTAMLTAQGKNFSQSFEGLCDNGDKTAWTQARDYLVDEALDEITGQNAQALATLLCDADPEEALTLSYCGITLALVSNEAETGYSIEREMPDIILERDDGVPVATFHVLDEDEDFEGIDEAQAHALAAYCAAALSERATPPWHSVKMERFDGSTFQITAIIGGKRCELAVVSDENADDAELADRAQHIVNKLN